MTNPTQSASFTDRPYSHPCPVCDSPRDGNQCVWHNQAGDMYELAVALVEWQDERGPWGDLGALIAKAREIVGPQ